MHQQGPHQGPYQGQPYQGQPYQQGPHQQPYQGQPYQGQPYQGQPYQGKPYPNGGASRSPLDHKFWTEPLRMRRAWNGPQRKRPDMVPDTRPQAVVVTALVFAVQWLLHAIGFSLDFADGPWQLAVTAGVVGILLLALLYGVWTGREFGRWFMMRIGIGIGAALLLGSFMSLAMSTGPLSEYGPGLGIQIVKILAAILLIVSGVLTMLPSVRAWCAGRWY